MITCARAALLSLTLALASGCGYGLRGDFHARGGAVGTWDLVPTRCKSGRPLGLVAADMFSTRSQEDTEVVAVAPGSTGPFVLARIPGKDRLLVLRSSVCSTFRVDMRTVGALVEGSLDLECALPDGGHFAGTARFTCP